MTSVLMYIIPLSRGKLRRMSAADQLAGKECPRMSGGFAWQRATEKTYRINASDDARRQQGQSEGGAAVRRREADRMADGGQMREKLLLYALVMFVISAVFLAGWPWRAEDKTLEAVRLENSDPTFRLDPESKPRAENIGRMRIGETRCVIPFVSRDGFVLVRPEQGFSDHEALGCDGYRAVLTRHENTYAIRLVDQAAIQEWQWYEHGIPGDVIFPWVEVRD